jgi:hypothetical protein
MPATISVAMSNKTGPPKCETVIVHCALELGEDSPMLQDPESIQFFLHSAFVACHEALHEESDSAAGRRSCIAQPRRCSS